MNNRHSIGFLLACFALFLGSPIGLAAGSRTDESLGANFLQHATQTGKLDATQLEELRHSIADPANASLEAAITEALARIYPDYRLAVQASDDDDLNRARQTLAAWIHSEDKFLAADASFYLARTLMNHERFEEAIDLLKQLNGGLSDYSAHRSTAQYYLGLAQAGLLQNDLAVQSLMEFLQFNPDAPERLRVGAWRQIQQIQAIAQGQMDDVYQRMDFSRRRLEIIESGDRTQEEQENIVKMLKKLIQEQEKKECSNCKGKSEKNAESQPQQQQAQKEQQQNSESQTGGKSNVANGKYVEKSFDTGNASPWSRLRDRSRDPANTAIKDKLPARYREIVERYYDAVNGNESPGDSADDHR